MKNFLLIATLISASAFGAQNQDGSAGNPQSLKIKVHRLYASTNGDCSDPVLVIDKSSNPTFVSMLSQPDFGNGSLADGTYNCIMIEMSDNLKFTPDGAVGNHCGNGTEYILDVCGNNSSYTKQDGTTGTCTGDNGTTGANKVDTKVILYLSTFSTSTTGSNAFAPPSAANDASNGIKLTNPLTVAGAVVALFDVDGTGKVKSMTGTGGDPSYCEFEPPAFSFSLK